MNAKQLEVVDSQKLFPIAQVSSGKWQAWEGKSVLFVCETKEQAQEAVYEYICECEFTDAELGLEA